MQKTEKNRFEVVGVISATSGLACKNISKSTGKHTDYYNKVIYHLKEFILKTI